MHIIGTVHLVGIKKVSVHKMRGISWLAENRLASQDGLRCVEYVNKEGNKDNYCSSPLPPHIYVYLLRRPERGAR